MTLIVDIHEPAEIIDLLRSHLTVEVKSITPGDYLIGSIAIERKTLPDFLNSLVQKRLFEQLSRLKSCYPVSFLIVESFDTSLVGNTAVLYGAILHIMLGINIKIIFTQSGQQTAEVILLLAGKKSAQTSTIIHQPKQISFQERQIQLLESIPQVGRARAMTLLHHFHTLDRLFGATEEELRSISGIGRKSIKNIKKMWEMEYKK